VEISETTRRLLVAVGALASAQGGEAAAPAEATA
jgi:hypothetical protein